MQNPKRALTVSEIEKQVLRRLQQAPTATPHGPANRELMSGRQRKEVTQKK
jgi:hypothetical protein